MSGQDHATRAPAVSASVDALAADSDSGHGAEPQHPLRSWFLDDSVHADPAASVGVFDYYGDDARDAQSVRGKPNLSGRAAALAEARGRTRKGFCDSRDGSELCFLDEDERASYRNKIESVVTTAQINWTAAVNALKVDKQLAEKKISFEQRLGEALFGLLFSALETGLVKAVKAGTGMAGKQTGAASDSALEADGAQAVTPPSAKSPAEPAIKQGVKVAQAELKRAGKVTGASLRKRAQQPIPATEVEFLQAMKSAPTLWASSIREDSWQLSDDDLLALHNSLPEPKQVDQAHFEERILGTLERFKAQVQTVAPTRRAVRVMNDAGAMRTALVVPEVDYGADQLSSSKEWRHEPAKTGRWKFECWVDDDFESLALARSALPANGASVTGVNEIRRTNDMSFWSLASLPHLHWDAGADARDERKKENVWNRAKFPIDL